MNDMEPEREAQQSYEQMLIVEKYETVIAYLYPIAQSMPRRHGVARKRSVVGARRKIRRYLRNGDQASLGRFMASWQGHAAHADVCNLFNHLEAHYGVRCH